MVWRACCLLGFIVLFGTAEASISSRYDDDRKMHPDLPTTRNAAPFTLEQNNDYWHNYAQATLIQKLNKKLNVKKAKNIIMFLGDGMSIHTVTAARSLIGGEASQISFEKFPHVGLSKTYCVNKQVADSACTATAYLCGVKANYGTMGVNAKVERFNCEQALDESTFTPSIAKWATNAGKDSGFVTTARVTHASPGGLYAHTANRDWENDAKVLQHCPSNTNIDIAEQLVEWDTGKEFKVILGGGRREFLDRSMFDEEGVPGYRSDGKNLINRWKEIHDSMGNATYVWNRDGLLSVDPGRTDYLFGLFNENHCSYHGDLKRDNREHIEPTLTEMTEAAIKMLQKNEKGFFLFVEGARIDLAHHDNYVRRSLEDTVEMGRALQKARDMTSEDDTLIVVTADHAHTMSINGYPYRGVDIFGLSGANGSDDLPYTILSYANGPGFETAYSPTSGRRDISLDDLSDAEYMYPSAVPRDSETHGGDDVGVFASGPYSHLFVGNYEQNNIPLMMAYAAEIGPYEGRTDGAAELTCTLSLIVASLLVAFKYLF